MRIFYNFFLFIVAVTTLCSCGESIKRDLPPVLNNITVKSTGLNSVTISDITFSSTGNPIPVIYATISEKVNGKQGDVLQRIDNCHMGARFSSLDPNREYIVSIIAENSSGSSVKELMVDKGTMGPVDPDSYYIMDKTEIAQLRWFLKIADQDIDDFSSIPYSNINGIPGTGKIQFAMSSYRYSVAFTTYFLALEQFHKLSACPGIIKPRYDRLIQKMINKQVWEYWERESMGVFVLEPDFNTPYPSERDPIRVRNIMYSGHLGQMIALYEKLYMDLKWSEPGSIVFKYSETEKYVYDNHSLQKLMFNEMMTRPENCIECQPNACFPECNQHPILSFLVYDQVHGTDYFKRAKGPLMDWYLRTEQVDPVTHSVAALYLVKQKRTIKQNSVKLDNILDMVTVPASMLGIALLNSAACDGWNGAFMNTWQPEFMNMHYPYQARDRIVELDGENARSRKDGLVDQISTPFFAMMASEMGDAELTTRLLNWIENHYKPKLHDDGTMRYPIGNEIAINLHPGFSSKATALTGKLAAIARANHQNGISEMHNNPFVGTDPSTPIVTGVNFPKIILRRAIYDPSREALVMTTCPGTSGNGSTPVKIIRLKREKAWQLFIDGKKTNRFEGVESIVIDIPLDGEHDIILAAE